MEIINKFLKRVNKTDSCWFWTGRLDKHGYGESKLIGRMAPHRISYTLFKSEIPKGMFVCHSCDVRNCVNPDHLWIGTTEDNMKDMALKGRIHSKLSVQDVLEIRKSVIDYYYGMYVDLAKKFSVSPTHIRKIVTMEKRKHVTGGLF